MVDFIFRRPDCVPYARKPVILRPEGPKEPGTVPNGDLVAAGERRPLGQTESDYFLIRTNSQGDLIWKQWYDKPGYQNAKDLLATPNGELAIIGETYQLNPARQTILKTDGNGDELWVP